MRKNLKKVLDVFQPNSYGISDWKTIEEVINAGLSWSSNGNVRRGIAFGVSEYNWEFRRSSKRKITEIRLVGHNKKFVNKQLIRKDILIALRQQQKSNFAPECLIPLNKDDKEVDHRWGRKDHFLYEYMSDINLQSIDDFQLLSHSHNQFKREQCVKCTKTGIRYPPPNSMDFKIGNFVWNDEIGCKGCPLAQPEFYR